MDAALARRLREQARRLGVSVASLCHLAWARVLAKVSGREDVVFGTVLFGACRGGRSGSGDGAVHQHLAGADADRGGRSGGQCAAYAQAAVGLAGHEHASLALAQRCSRVPAPAPLFSALLNYRHSSGSGQSAFEESKRGPGKASRGCRGRSGPIIP